MLTSRKSSQPWISSSSCCQGIGWAWQRTWAGIPPGQYGGFSRCGPAMAFSCDILSAAVASFFFFSMVQNVACSGLLGLLLPSKYAVRVKVALQRGMSAGTRVPRCHAAALPRCGITNGLQDSNIQDSNTSKATAVAAIHNAATMLISCVTAWYLSPHTSQSILIDSSPPPFFSRCFFCGLVLSCLGPLVPWSWFACKADAPQRSLERLLPPLDQPGAAVLSLRDDGHAVTQIDLNISPLPTGRTRFCP